MNPRPECNQLRSCLVVKTILLGIVATAICACAITDHSYVSTDGIPISEIQAERSVITFRAENFTRSHVDVSPDGKYLVFDAVGHIYKVPIEGGIGIPLTSGESWNMWPRFSPGGQRIAFISDRSGAFERWVMESDGVGLTMFPGVYSELNPTDQVWSPSGRIVSATASASGVELFSWLSASQKDLFYRTGNGKEFELAKGAWSADGKYQYFGGDALYKRSAASGEEEKLVNYSETNEFVFKVRISSNSEVVAYYTSSGVPSYDGKHEECVLRIHHLNKGRTVTLKGTSAPCVTRGKNADYDLPDYALLPDGSSIITNVSGRFVRFDTTSGSQSNIQIAVDVARSAAPTPKFSRSKELFLNYVRARAIRWPVLSSDNSMLVFNAFGKNYAKNTSTGVVRRLTNSSLLEYGPSISPDGRWVAYSTWDDNHLGHVMIVPVEGGSPRQLTRNPGRYANPTWSHNGKMLAFISDEDSNALFGLRRDSSNNIWLKLIKLPVSMEYGDVHDVTKVASLHWDIGRFYPTPAFLPGDNRLIVATNLRKDRGGVDQVLVSFNLDGEDQLHHFGFKNVDEAVVAPDGRHVAAIIRGRLYIEPIQQSGDSTELSILSPDENKSITSNAPVYMSWTNSNEVVWAEATSVFRYELGRDNKEFLTEVDVTLPRDVPSGCVAFVNSRVITLTERNVLDDATVRLCNGRISYVGDYRGYKDSSASDSDLVVEGVGKTIIPGIVDAHGHILGVGEVWSRQDMSFVGHLAYGVTTVFDPQAQVIEGIGRYEMVETGAAIGPRIFTSGSMIFGRNEESYSHRNFDITSIDRARDVVWPLARVGAGPVKSYEDTSRLSRQLTAQAAREIRLAVTSHHAGYEHAVTHPIDGISIEHSVTLVRNIELQDDIIQLIAESGVGYTIDSIGSGKYPIDTENYKINRLVPSSLLSEFGSAESDSSYMELIKVREARSLARLFELGGLPSIGAHGSGIPGLSTHFDLWALVDNGGMRPEDALRVATINGAKKIGMGEQIGTIEAGKLADLIILNSNPLDNIHNSIDIGYVVKGGVIYDGETMMRLYPENRLLEPWPWQSDSDRLHLAPKSIPNLEFIN